MNTNRTIPIGSIRTIPIVILWMITISTQTFAFQSPHPRTCTHTYTSNSNQCTRSTPVTTAVSTTTATTLFGTAHEDLYGAIHRKEYEMEQLKRQHANPSDPLQMALGYVQEYPENYEELNALKPQNTRLRMAKAFRRIYDYAEEEDVEEDEETDADGVTTGGKLTSDMMRRGSLTVDVKRKSLSSGDYNFANFPSASMVAEAMVNLGADAVFINIDPNYGGDPEELKTAVKAVRKLSTTAAVIMKDIVVDEIQLAMAKEAGCDGVLLIASVLGPALPQFLDTATVMGLETLVEVHTRTEVTMALEHLAQNLLVTNYDRVSGQYFDDQAENLAGMFPGNGPIVSLATGGIEDPTKVRELLCAGYDGVVVGRAIMGNVRASEFIKAVRDRPLLPAEFAGWGLDDLVDVEEDGSVKVKEAETQPQAVEGNRGEVVMERTKPSEFE